MRELEQAIARKFREAYPLLMTQEDGSFSRFGFEFGNGWLPLVFEIFGLLEDLQQMSGEAVRISQVKEKFGSLRLYLGCGNSIADDVDLIETLGEQLSVSVCDICGAPGRRGDDGSGYWCTRCSDHRGARDWMAVDKASQEAGERFLQYQRQGLDTSGIVFLMARKSASDETLGELRASYFPDRIVSASDGLAQQLRVEEFVGETPEHLHEIVQGLSTSERRIAGYTDGSEVGNIIMGRPR